MISNLVSYMETVEPDWGQIFILYYTEGLLLMLPPDS